MKLNRSLAISNKVHECKTGNIIGLMEKHFPIEVLNNQSVDTEKQSRSRVFTVNNTLLTMTLAATQKDKKRWIKRPKEKQADQRNIMCVYPSIWKKTFR